MMDEEELYLLKKRKYRFNWECMKFGGFCKDKTKCPLKKEFKK